MSIPTLSRIAEALATLPPAPDLPSERHNHASVALILSGSLSPEIFFIRRAPHPLDPWSGDIGFPGGRIDPDDTTSLAAAHRETTEEIGIDLTLGNYFGTLPELRGDHLPVRISCHVFGLEPQPEISPNEEVAGSIWVPLAYFLNPAVHAVRPVLFKGSRYDRPSVRLPDPDLPVLWGITYRLFLSFCGQTGISLPLITQD